MENSYWLGRKKVSVENAEQATNSNARLIHLELAGRYSLKALEATKNPNSSCR